jgi:hypothetical protein
MTTPMAVDGSVTRTLMTIAVSAVCAGASYGMYKLLSPEQVTVSDPNETSVIVPLLHLEEMLIAFDEKPISTCTWFKGDYTTAAFLLQHRMDLIISANPWLGGRIVELKGKHAIAYAYPNGKHEHEQTPELVTPIFTVVSQNTTLNPTCEISDYGKSCKTYLVSSARGQEQALWKVTVVPCANNPSTTFAVISSMSHVVADGHTFYQFHNMLLSQDTIASLTCARIPTSANQQIQAMGKKEHAFLSSAAFIGHAIFGFVLASFITPLCGIKLYSRCLVVDPQKMETAKREHDDTVKFLSTNDVITSWFFRTAAPTFGLMAINWRGRLHGHTDMHAGNYESLITYLQGDYEAPEQIRSSLDKFCRLGRTHKPLPTLLETLFAKSALISNWSSFAKANHIPGCQELMHVPVYDLAAVLPANMRCSLIFRAGPGKTAVMIFGYGEQFEKASCNTTNWESQDKLVY